MDMRHLQKDSKGRKPLRQPPTPVSRVRQLYPVSQMKSPLSDEVVKDEILTRKLQDIFNEEIDLAYIFYIPKKGEARHLEYGMCGHQLITLGKQLIEDGEAMIENGE